jgi:hypothetical protein
MRPDDHEWRAAASPARIRRVAALCAALALIGGSVAGAAHAGDCGARAVREVHAAPAPDTRLEALLLTHRPYLAVQRTAQPEQLTHR